MTTRQNDSRPNLFPLTKLLLLCGILFLFSCQQGQSDGAFPRNSVSMINVIAQPDNYHGKKVTVIGVLRLDFEGHMLFFAADDARHGNIHNSLWLRLDEEQENLFRPHASYYVAVEGVFDATDHGHLGSFVGAIGKIESIQRLPTATEPAVPPSLLQRPIPESEDSAPSNSPGET